MSKKKSDNQNIFCAGFTTTYSYPVLSTSSPDYKSECSFSLTYDISYEKEENEKNLIFDFSYDLEAEDLKHYIENGQVRAAVTITCALTSFIETIDFPKDRSRIIFKIPTQDLFGKVYFQLVLYAPNEIIDFTCPNDLDENLYSVPMKYHVEKGGILAFAPSANETIREMETEAETFAGTIILVSRDDDDPDAYSLDFHRDKISLALGQKPNDIYHELGLDYCDYSITIYLQSVLTEAISLLKYQRYEYLDYRWAELIENKIQDLYGQSAEEILEDYSAGTITAKILSEQLEFVGNQVVEKIKNYSLED